MSFTRPHRISSIDIEPTKTDGPTNPVEIASYNWYRSSTEEHPRIVVPGRPASLRSDIKVARDVPTLDFDSGLYVADENQLNQPDCPMESVFQSVHILNPGFDWQGVDVVTDRTNLRQLIGFLIPKRADSSGAFVIDVDVVDNTVVFTRTGPTRARCFGCGHHFEEAMTTDEADGALRRVVSFELGTLKLVVRSEVDALEGGLWKPNNSLVWTKPDNSILEVAHSGGPLEGKRGNFVELKTKSVRREFDWVEAYTQMALGDIDVLVLARMQVKTVASLQKFSRQEVARAKIDNNRLFGRLEALLAAILRIVRPKERPGEERSFVIEWDGNTRDLHIRKTSHLAEASRLSPAARDLIKPLQVEN